MWKLFKTDEEKKQIKQQKLAELQKEVNRLNVEHNTIIDTFCKAGNYVFIFKGFFIRNDKIKFDYIDKNTPKGYTNSSEFYWFNIQFDKTIKEARTDWISFKGDLEKLGIELKLLNNEQTN